MFEINRTDRKYFEINVSEYDETKDFEVVRPASLNYPYCNSVMFLQEGYEEKAAVLESVRNCLVFLPESMELPADLCERHCIVRSNNPHTDFCRFFRDHRIASLPRKEDVKQCDFSWVAEGATIGSNVIIQPGVYIGGDVFIGNNVYIGTGAKIVGEVYIGDNVVIRENAVVGADGLTTDREDDGTAVTMPQFGYVAIEDDVQIGAGTIIARGAIDGTIIRKGAKIDNSSFISHNVEIGSNTFVVGETIFFGSSSTGVNCIVSGNSTVRNGIHIGDSALVGMGSVVTKPVSANAIVKGNPAK